LRYNRVPVPLSRYSLGTVGTAGRKRGQINGVSVIGSCGSSVQLPVQMVILTICSGCTVPPHS
jgi:hypothetical protein